MKYMLVCLLTLTYVNCYACNCVEEVANKHKEYSFHYVYKFCKTPDQAYKRKINYDSWWRGYIQAHNDIQNLLFVKNIQLKYMQGIFDTQNFEPATNCNIKILTMQKFK